jgi:hypothetical protein
MRFTIRDLLWLTLLVAVLVAWWVDRQAMNRRIEELERVTARMFLFDTTSDLDLAAPSPNQARSP